MSFEKCKNLIPFNNPVECCRYSGVEYFNQQRLRLMFISESYGARHPAYHYITLANSLISCYYYYC